MGKQITDKRALDLIAALLSKGDWSADTASDISDIVELTGRHIEEND